GLCRGAQRDRGTVPGGLQCHRWRPEVRVLLLDRQCRLEVQLLRYARWLVSTAHPVLASCSRAARIPSNPRRSLPPIHHEFPKMNSRKSLFLCALALMAPVVVCAAPGKTEPAPGAVKPRIITEPVKHDTDDPAIWINPADP